MKKSSPKDELLFLPLGGAGEIGMNLNLYGYGPEGKESWIMVDLGITFGNGTVPGVDVILPDPEFIVERKKKLKALVLTHAHEDHIGAVPYLWDRLRCPIYATPFTVSILKNKLAEAKLLGEAEINVIPLNGSFSIGPFDLELITLTHSIPEPNGIAIRTPLGTVLHTGDWKFDPNPVLGEVSDEAALRRLGDEGVLAVICDSTNVFSPGTSGSEGDLLDGLVDVINTVEGRVVVTCFASNVARIETIARAAQQTGRSVVLSGRSLQRMVEAARENGYLQDTPKFLVEEDAKHLPRDNCLIICTGSQGEPRASLFRMAFEEHPRLKISSGDTVIFSARSIPGNEISIGRIQNQLIRRGMRVVTDRDAFIHVSGHPCRDELIQMYQHVKPQIAVPVHGELRHLSEHAALARTCQVAEAVINENGGIVRLAPGPAGVIDHVPSGRLTLEGGRVVPLGGELVRGRTRALLNGAAVLTIAVDMQGDIVAEPKITTEGLVEPGSDDAIQIERTALEIAVGTLNSLPMADRRDDGAAAEAVRVAVRRFFRDTFGKRPVTTIHLVRIADA